MNDWIKASINYMRKVEGRSDEELQYVKTIAIFADQEFAFFDGKVTDDDMVKIGDGIPRKGTILIVETGDGIVFPFGVPAGGAEGKIALWSPFLGVERALFREGIIKTDPAQFLPPGLKGEEP